MCLPGTSGWAMKVWANGGRMPGTHRIISRWVSEALKTQGTKVWANSGHSHTGSRRNCKAGTRDKVHDNLYESPTTEWVPVSNTRDRHSSHCINTSKMAVVNRSTLICLFNNKPTATNSLFAQTHWRLLVYVILYSLSFNESNAKWLKQRTKMPEL